MIKVFHFLFDGNFVGLIFVLSNSNYFLWKFLFAKLSIFIRIMFVLRANLELEIFSHLILRLRLLKDFTSFSSRVIKFLLNVCLPSCMRQCFDQFWQRGKVRVELENFSFYCSTFFPRNRKIMATKSWKF